MATFADNEDGGGVRTKINESLTKTDFLTVTGATNLDAIRAAVAQLSAALRASVADATALAAIAEADCSEAMVILVRDTGTFWRYVPTEDGTDGAAVFPSDVSEGVGAWLPVETFRINIEALGGDAAEGDTSLFLNKKGQWSKPLGTVTVAADDPADAPIAAGLFWVNSATRTIRYSTGTGTLADWNMLLSVGDIVADTEVVTICLFDSSEDVTTGDGAGGQLFRVPAKLDGWSLTSAVAYVATAGATGATTVQVANVTQGVEMLTAAASVPSAGTEGSGTVDPANDDVAAGDMLRGDVDTVSTTAPKGLWLELTFTAPVA